MHQQLRSLGLLSGFAHLEGAVVLETECTTKLSDAPTLSSALREGCSTAVRLRAYEDAHQLALPAKRLRGTVRGVSNEDQERMLPFRCPKSMSQSGFTGAYSLLMLGLRLVCRRSIRSI